MHRYVGVLFALLAALHNIQVLAAGNIGCLFSDTLCEQEREWCFDDHAFGHCLSDYGHYREDDLHRYDLGSDELRLLEQEMQRLFLLGYRWSHTYTQCVLQELLRAIRHTVDFDISSCNGDVDQDLEGALRAIEGEELVDPRDLAIVRFTPSATDPHSDFADEVYFPPIKDPEEGEHQDGGSDDDQAEAGDHQESPTSEPGESSSGGTDGGGGNNQGDSNGSSSPHFHPMGGIDTYPANPPGPPLSDSPVSAPASYRDHQPPPPPPPYDPREQNYIRVYDPDMVDYDDHYEDDDSTSYRSPYHYQTPLNPVYRKRSRPVEEVPKMSVSQIRRIASLLDNFRLQKNDLEDQDALEEGVFGESPTRPMYSEAGLQFIPEVAEDEDLMENAAREAILSNMPQDLHAVEEGFRSMPDEYRNVPGVLDSFSPGTGRKYMSSLRNLPEALRNYPEGLDVLPGGYSPIGPQDFRGPEPMENSIPRSIYMPDVGPLDDSKDDLPWNRLMMEEEEEEDELENSFPPTNNKNTAFQELFGPQLNAIRNFDDGDDFNDYQDYREELLDEYGDYGTQYDVLGQAFPFLQKFDKKDEERAGDDDDMVQDGEWSFKRPERLDVKKPGPGFGVNNYAFGDGGDAGLLNEGIAGLIGERPQLTSRLIGKGMDMPRAVMDTNPEGPEMLADFAPRDTQQIPDVVQADEGIVEEATGEVASVPKAEKLQEKKEQDGSPEATPTQAPPKELERPASFVHITTANKFETEKDGEDLARYLIKLSGLTEAHVMNPKVDGDQLLFQVKENYKGITASDVAKTAEELREQVEAETGHSISQSGIGDETTMLALVYSSNKKHIVAAAAIVCGVMAALLVVASVLFFLRRNAKSKAKLLGLTAHDTEASKDYQDLCRARMAGKAGENGKVEPPTTHAPTQRIASLSKDSDNGNNSPSSRSSTSSCEEPVASNMDISTGHMVLNYMEDHLKNKDRLEQEWIALCAYEAEPCATTIAMKPENNKKNRYPDSVPYDHNRVILNSHANVNGSDYINASSITDHDPRNPAYIATQGPLSTTAADFWQLVWEQGSVVIVMLTRLTENGLAFCHRYWPEEGSDLYHIYEVHLVSEHIWCDDYLVRSFYLKNVKTGETRTVTQFHFLSWPDSGTPASTKALLEFRRKVNKSYRGRSCPIIVHCSDGIGRTGTYSLIDMVLNRMAKGAKEIDIAATLEHIRDQRPHMVKSKGQFEFVLMAVAEEVHAILKALPQ